LGPKSPPPEPKEPLTKREQAVAERQKEIRRQDKQRLLESGYTQEQIERMRPSERAAIAHQIFLDQKCMAEYGMTYEEWYAKQQLPLGERRKRQQQALDEGLPLEELPEGMPDDEYYDYLAKQRYRGA